MCGRLRVGKEIFALRCWSVQPCVRPVGAVHMTAGHNALCGSGPGQNRAFDNAVAYVDCPDRRIDRLCITFALPTFTSRRMSSAISLRRKRDGFLVALTLAIMAQAIRAILLASAMARPWSASAPIMP
jgi:hypothetical protein